MKDAAMNKGPAGQMAGGSQYGSDAERMTDPELYENETRMADPEG